MAEGVVRTDGSEHGASQQTRKQLLTTEVDRRRGRIRDLTEPAQEDRSVQETLLYPQGGYSSGSSPPSWHPPATLHQSSTSNSPMPRPTWSRSSRKEFRQQILAEEKRLICFPREGASGHSLGQGKAPQEDFSKGEVSRAEERGEASEDTAVPAAGGGNRSEEAEAEPSRGVGTSQVSSELERESGAWLEGERLNKAGAA